MVKRTPCPSWSLFEGGKGPGNPLSYYKLGVPVAPLPRALNEEAVRAGSAFLQQEARHRFLALAFVESYGALDWLWNKAAGTHDVRELGVFDGVKVWNLCPHTGGMKLIVF